PTSANTVDRANGGKRRQGGQNTIQPAQEFHFHAGAHLISPAAAAFPALLAGPGATAAPLRLLDGRVPEPDPPPAGPGPVHPLQNKAAPTRSAGPLRSDRVPRPPGRRGRLDQWHHVPACRRLRPAPSTGGIRQAG